MFEQALAEKIMQIVVKNGKNILLATHVESFNLHVQRLVSLLREDKEVLFVLPAFPAKSSNRCKTIGPLPDAAELLGLKNLQETCEEIASLYAPGARVVVCSDGHVFSDLVGVNDDDVTLYTESISNMIREQKYHRIDIFTTKHAFPHSQNFVHMRSMLVDQCGQDLSSLRQAVVDNVYTRSKFNGIHRFIFEDTLARNSSASRNRIREESKLIAYQVVQRSDSWGGCIAKHFPGAMRLSIHPQPEMSVRIGFQLVVSADNWATPWHNAAILEENGFRLIKRKDAEEKRASVDFLFGKYPYFTMM